MNMGPSGIWAGLIHFDILRLRRGFELVLARWQDRLVLLLMVLFAILVGTAALGRPPGLAVAPSWAALAAFLLAALIAAAHGRRLARLASQSIAAPFALAKQARAAHLAAVSILSLILALAIARAAALTGFQDWPAIGFVVLAWAAGTMIGATGEALRRHRRWRPDIATSTSLHQPSPRSVSLLAITLRTQLPFAEPRPALVAAFALGAGQAVAVGLLIQSLNPFAGGAVAVIVALAASFAVARVPAGPCRFGIFAGVPTGHALAACLAAPTALTLGAFFGGLFLIRADPGLASLELGCGLAALLATAFRVLHYRLHPKPRADRLMQAQILLLAMAAAGLPPMTPLLVAFRAFALYRANRNAMWAVA